MLKLPMDSDVLKLQSYFQDFLMGNPVSHLTLLPQRDPSQQFDANKILVGGFLDRKEQVYLLRTKPFKNHKFLNHSSLQSLFKPLPSVLRLQIKKIYLIRYIFG